MGYNGRIDDDAPVSGRYVSFDCDDFLHIKEKYDDDWWIGRVVSNDEHLGFIPSPVKIEKIRLYQKSRPQRSTKMNKASVEESHFAIIEKERKKGESKNPYEVVPNVRPVLLVGPSLKGLDRIKNLNVTVCKRDRIKCTTGQPFFLW